MHALSNVKDLLFDAAILCSGTAIIWRSAAIIRAAEEEDAPVIIQASQVRRKRRSLLPWKVGGGKFERRRTFDHGTLNR